VLQVEIFNVNFLAIALVTKVLLGDLVSMKEDI